MLPARSSTIVIGGGVLGCSTLYHLAKAGVDDVILLERNKLTSGTTWHSAAQVRQLRSTRNLTRLIQYSAQLYQSLEAETGQSTGWISKGSLSIAATPDRLHHVRQQAALAKAYGVAVEEVTREDIRHLWPLVNDSDLLGAVFSPDDGRVNPSDLCLALTKGARQNGATIFEDTAVIDIVVKDNRVAGVETEGGFIAADNVVICTGLWSRRLAAMAGIELPIVPCHHYYLLTRPIEGINDHLPTLSDHDSHLYIRDDVGGLLIGCFEPGAVPINPADIAEDFAFSLLPEDWDHFEPMMVNAMHRIPALEQAQVRTLLNGPESFSHDGSFFLGQTQQVEGLFLGCGLNSVGIATGGGAGWALAHWVTHGEAPFHLGDTDPDRAHASENRLATLMPRAAEVLGRHYEIHYPGVQMHSARNLRLTPLHDRWINADAHFVQVFGWERPAFFNAKKPPKLQFGRPVWFDQIALEVQAAHTRVAVFDLSTFGKIRVAGPDAETFLQRVCANDMTRAAGRVIYTGLLNNKGGFHSDLSALRIAQNEYLLYTGTGAITRDLFWLKRQIDPWMQVTCEDVTESLAVLGLSGPHADAVVTALGADHLQTLPYFSHTLASIAGIQTRVARLSYVGEAGFEISCNATDATTLYDAFCNHGAVPAGLYAQSAMRIEKGFLAMGRDLDADITPIEAGLDFAVDYQHEFLGHTALAKKKTDGCVQRRVTLILDDHGCFPSGNEPIYRDDRCIGQITSAAFGFRVGKSVALGYVDDVTAVELGQLNNVGVTLDMGNRRTGATATLTAAFDPSGTRMKQRSQS